MYFLENASPQRLLDIATSSNLAVAKLHNVEGTGQCFMTPQHQGHGQRSNNVFSCKCTSS